MAPRFPSPLQVPILNHLTGRTYRLGRAADLVDSPETTTSLTTICNEPDIYEWLFRQPLAGQPYTTEKAAQFLHASRTGWAASTHFIFAVCDESGQLAAACDIKSNDPVAEIGYWASREHPGIMTNTVTALSQLAAAAGYRGLFARTKEGNVRSQQVLARASFVQTEETVVGYNRFILTLTDKPTA